MMKRTLKRGLSMMMAILLVVGLFGNLGITASAAASVTLYTAGGAITSADWTAVTSGSTYTYSGAAATVTLPTPSIRSATAKFGGWYSSASLGGSAVTSATSGTYYAKWTFKAISANSSNMWYCPGQAKL